MQTAYKSVRLFKSPLLEKFSHIHPLTPLLVWAPVVAWLLWRSFNVLELSSLSILVAGAGGLLLWTFSEYVLHRFVFHFQPKGEVQERLQFILHGIHHADPVDPTRLVMPPAVALILAVVLYSLFRALLGAVYVEPMFAFFLVGYLCYDYIHFGVHHFTPRTRVGKYLKQSHMIHHYVNHNLRWGVSSPLWDYVFGTYAEPVPIKRAKPREGIRKGLTTAKPVTVSKVGAMNRVGHGS
jgi:sterol desaturase/sphingolipid hydroxylase (fatty acid hydroxylase superfamily)